MPLVPLTAYDSLGKRLVRYPEFPNIHVLDPCDICIIALSKHGTVVFWLTQAHKTPPIWNSPQEHSIHQWFSSHEMELPAVLLMAGLQGDGRRDRLVFFFKFHLDIVIINQG